MDELEQVKILIGLDIDDEKEFDDFITLQLDRANNIIKNSTRFYKQYKYLAVDAVVFAYNLQGSEGSKSNNFIGVSNNWDASSMDRYIKSRLPNQYILVGK